MTKKINAYLAAMLLTIGGFGCKPARNAASFFPASNEAAGWVQVGEIRTFTAGDLWKYIDGEAERYLKGGVKSVATGDYKFEDKIDTVVDIYTMATSEGVKNLYDSESAGDAKVIQVGDSARLYSQSLIFRKGRYLVRIVAYEESARIQPAITELGQRVEQRLTR